MHRRQRGRVCLHPITQPTWLPLYACFVFCLLSFLHLPSPSVRFVGQAHMGHKTPPVHFALNNLEMGISWTICPGYLWTTILLISASQVARIAGVGHRCLTWYHLFFFRRMVLGFELRTSHLLGRCSITWATPPALLCWVFWARVLWTIWQDWVPTRISNTSSVHPWAEHLLCTRPSLESKDKPLCAALSLQKFRWD
jgi:hypothetical protein